MEKYTKPIVSETELDVEEIILASSPLNTNEGKLNFGEGDGEIW